MVQFIENKIPGKYEYRIFYIEHFCNPYMNIMNMLVGFRSMLVYSTSTLLAKLLKNVRGGATYEIT